MKPLRAAAPDCAAISIGPARALFAATSRVKILPITAKVCCATSSCSATLSMIAWSGGVALVDADADADLALAALVGRDDRQRQKLAVARTSTRTLSVGLPSM